MIKTVVSNNTISPHHNLVKAIVLIFFSLLFVTHTHAQTVRKLVFEEITGTWCGWCPEGAIELSKIIKAYPDRVIPIAIHDADQLRVREGHLINFELSQGGYPAGMVDRLMDTVSKAYSSGPENWAVKTKERLDLSAIASVSFSDLSFDGTTYKGTVNAKFNTAPDGVTPIVLQVFLIEDSIPAVGNLAQTNYSQKVQNGASPLANWFHNHTLRRALGGLWGWSTAVPKSPTLDSIYNKKFDFIVPSTWVAKHVKAVGFVAYNGEKDANKKEIFNGEIVPLDWFSATTGLNNPTEVLQAVAYPNPATTHTTIALTFNLSSDAEVQFDVIDATGKVVSTPYASYEIAGTHTIRWYPASNAVSPGIYFARLRANNGQRGTYVIFIQ